MASGRHAPRGWGHGERKPEALLQSAILAAREASLFTRSISESGLASILVRAVFDRQVDDLTQRELEELTSWLEAWIVDLVCGPQSNGSRSERPSSASNSVSRNVATASSTTSHNNNTIQTPITKSTLIITPPAKLDTAAWRKQVYIPGFRSGAEGIKQEASPRPVQGPPLQTRRPSAESRISYSSTGASALLSPTTAHTATTRRRVTSAARSRRGGKRSIADNQSDNLSVASSTSHACGFCGKGCKSPSDQAEHEAVHHFKLCNYKRYHCPVEGCLYRHHRPRDIVHKHLQSSHANDMPLDRLAVDKGEYPPGHTRESLLDLWRNRHGDDDHEMHSPPASIVSYASDQRPSFHGSTALDIVSERNTPTPDQMEMRTQDLHHVGQVGQFVYDGISPNAEQVLNGAQLDYGLPTQAYSQDNIFDELMKMNPNTDYQREPCLESIERFQQTTVDQNISPHASSAMWNINRHTAPQWDVEQYAWNSGSLPQNPTANNAGGEWPLGSWDGRSSLPGHAQQFGRRT